MANKTSHILIVDDNAENIRVLGASLERYKYKITIAQNGELAIKAAQEQIPDLILLDVMMPGLDGFQVCEILKSNPKTRHIEIIFITAAVAPAEELRGLSLGAVDYIFKPFSVPVVQAKVELHLERIHHKKLRDDVEAMARHDLKTPLNALMGYPQLMLLDDNLTEEQRDYLAEMVRAGNNMLSMINNSMDLFKMENGTYQYTPNLVEMVSVIKSIIGDLVMLTNETGIKIEFLVDGEENTDEKAFIVLAEQGLSYSLFGNLIRNAIEACSAGDTIVINMHNEDQYSVVTITNPGTVLEAVRATFFEKFATAGKSQGTGLGTYSAKLMTETQHGKIAMYTNAQETSITVRLPQHES